MRRIVAGLSAALVTVVVLAACSGSSPPTETAVAQPTETVVAQPTETVVAQPTETVDSGAETTRVATEDELFPTVVDATATTSDGTAWRVDVTLSSEYDTAERYADAWRVLDAADHELGIRVLTHDHANEQPFTRSATVEIPGDVDRVFIEGRDQQNGWSGERFELVLER